jgi:hypothetical protein
VEVLQRKTNLTIGQRQKPMRHDLRLEAPCPGTRVSKVRQMWPDLPDMSARVANWDNGRKGKKIRRRWSRLCDTPCPAPTPRLPCHHNNDVIIGSD